MEPKYITEAKALIGEHEIAGKLSNAKIKELYADAGHPEVVSDEVPWCAAFVGACLRRSNLSSTGTLLARDYANYGVKLTKPEKNCIGVMKRGNSGWEGHVGFVTDFDKDNVWMLGGNQGDKVSVRAFPRSKFIAFVKPKLEADKSSKNIVNDSRRLKTQTWYERLLVSLGLGGALSWNTLNEVKNFASDNAGLIILGSIGIAWIVSRAIKSMSLREYREGRYMPSKQWK